MKLIVAGNHDQANSWACGHHILPHRWKYVSRPTDLLGYSQDSQVLLVGDWSNLSGISCILEVMMERNMQWKHAK